MSEYLRRNLVVCKAVGARAEVDSIERHLAKMKRPPRWLVESLRATRERLEDLPRELAAHRDEVQP